MDVQQLAGLVFDRRQQGTELEVVVAVHQKNVRLKLRFGRRGQQHALIFPQRQARKVGEKPVRLLRILDAEQTADDLEGARAGGAVAVAKSDDGRPAPLGAFVGIQRFPLSLCQGKCLTQRKVAEGIPRDFRVCRNVGRILDQLDRLNVQFQIQKVLEPLRGLIALCHIAFSFYLRPGAAAPGPLIDRQSFAII